MKKINKIHLIIAVLVIVLIILMSAITLMSRSGNLPSDIADIQSPFDRDLNPTITTVPLPSRPLPSNVPAQPVLFLDITVDYRLATDLYVIYHQVPQSEAETQFDLYKQQAGITNPSLNVEYRSLSNAPLPPRAFPQ